MLKSGRKKKKKKQRGPHRVELSSAKTKEGNHPALSAAKLQADKAAIVSSSLFVKAPAEHCFDMLAKQLEEPPRWDPMVIDVKPLSPQRSQIKATSHMTFRLGRKKLATLAMISSYRPKRMIGWVSSDKPRVREDWKLEPRPNGTTIGVTLSYDAPRWFISRFLDSFMRRKQVERDINQMLRQFKEAAEGSSSDQANSSHK